MPFTPSAITQTRYMTELKALLVSWLSYHFRDGDGDEQISRLFANVGGGVDISAEYPSDQEEGQFLSKPRLCVGHNGERIDNTTMTSADGQYLQSAAYHTITLTLTAVCDEATGGQMTADDLMSAVGLCFTRFRRELEPVGVNLLRLQESRAEVSGDGTIRNFVEIVADVQVRGSNLSTVVLEMGRFTLTGAGIGTFLNGHTLTTPSALRVKMLTGVRAVPVEVTVYGLNASAAATTLTVTVPIGTSESTLLALTPATVGDTFTDVTNIEVSGGLAGEAFVVENIPQEV